MEWYIQMVTEHPIIMAIIQFAILGTFGEIISKWVVNKKVNLPFPWKLIVWKMIVWSILAVCIKYAFTGFKGYVDAVIDHHMLPEMCSVQGSIARAFAISFLINIQFGPFLVVFHRVLDNLVVKTKNWSGLDKGMLSMIWFWIPAHTITFSLPKVYQIGLAALWSVVLGIILGYVNKKK